MLKRRTVLKTMGGAGAGLLLGTSAGADEPTSTGMPAVGRRRIPSTGELLPMVGLGTSRTFDVDPSSEIGPATEVVRAFLDAGGSLVDSSPMYKRAESVVGAVLNELRRHDLFFATKVWTDKGRDEGIAQMERSIDRMAAPVMDLMQVHNLVALRTHLPTLHAWKTAGRIRYVGVTEMRDFDAVEKLMRDEDLDFIQIPYSIGDRRVEDRILPAARDTGTAVLVMRPFERGRLFEQVKGRPIPDWSAEIDCTSWAQIFLKFVLAHPAVTCPIPATSKVHHLVDNMRAGTGRLPDATLRERMIAAVTG